jgi:hypothetical protein
MPWLTVPAIIGGKRYKAKGRKVLNSDDYEKPWVTDDLFSLRKYNIIVLEI